MSEHPFPSDPKATETCRKCGAPFRPSPTGITVNCPACRKSDRPTRPEPSKLRTCRCGKTVIVSSTGVATGLTCPRACDVQ